ncbi:uncharacterized protein B0T15DRAFT_394962, partial [Chaetomium strumarium]
LIGSATLRLQNPPEGDGGEGSLTGGPDRERMEIDDWPTLVTEARDSESLNRLRDDISWLFTASEHDVKVVILAKFDH